jgi:uncharacterized protein (TIGR00645 family)
MTDRPQQPVYLRGLGSLIFFSRWLQAPLYLGLIVAQGVYVYQFFLELTHLLHDVISGRTRDVMEAGVLVKQTLPITEQEIMIAVLGMIDVVMIANLLVMVIVGGYETFVSRLNLRGHRDEPEWLSHVNAGALKVKLATALIGISSIHLLRSFIQLGTPVPGRSDAGVAATATNDPAIVVAMQQAATQAAEQASQAMNQTMLWQVVVHLTFVFSAILLAMTDRITTRSAIESKAAH